MSIETIKQQLSTPEGFAKTVSPRRGLFGFGITSLLLGIGAIGMNIFQLGSASDWDWQLIGMFFFNADAIEFTGYRAGRAEAWRFFYVYGPFLLIPLGLILLGIHFATRNKAGANLFSDFQERGWVGRQLLVGLTVQNGNAQQKVAFISHPSIPEETFFATAQQYNGYVESLDKKAQKALSKQAMKAGVLNGTSASALSPELPAEITVAPVQGKGEYAVVVPAADGAKGKMKVLPVKG